MDEVLKEFLAEASESIEALDVSLVRFEKQPDDPALLAEIFRVMHTIKGTCGFLNLPRLEHIAHAGEDVLGGFRDGVLTPSPASVGPILEAIDAIKHLLAGLHATGQEEAGDDTALIARINAIASGTPEPTAPTLSLDAIGGMATLDAAAEMLLADIAPQLLPHDPDRLQGDLRDVMASTIRNGGPSRFAAVLAAPLPAIADAVVFDAVLDQLDVGFAALGLDDALRASLRAALATPFVEQRRVAPAPPPAAKAEVDAPAPTGTPAAQTIRVSVDALEQLMNVVSELVLIRNQLLQTSRLNPDTAFSAPLQRLNHVTTELQESVMTTRMQPIGNAWSKLPRIVRDLAAELGKKVELDMHGAETELDRQVLELIKDPLTHMIRNAADHGLEKPDERLAAGKADTGRIFLQARHEGGHIVVEIGDDGRGLHIAKLRQKAIERGLMSRSDAEAATDAALQALIFHPGFSTAAAVTNVSGRGVGMDVVRTNIEKIGGTIELFSREGAGTRFTIRIPLTLTIVSALIVESAGRRFAMPQSSVVELVGTNASSRHLIEYLNGAPVLRLRDRLLPLISLQALLKLEPVADQPAETCIMVTQIGAFSFGIIVDRVFDTEEIVVKPVARVLKHIPLFSGNTILGDGSVIMILDPKGIATETGRLDSSGESEAFRQPRAEADDRVPILVVRVGAERWKAVPLSLVSRIEALDPSRIETVDGRDVLQYRGHLVPVIALDGAPLAFTAGKSKPVLVFEDRGRDFALVVDDVLDIVEQSLTTELAPTGEGRLGSLIVSGRAADLIDLSHYWTMVAGRDELGGVAATSARPRVLLVEPNPFFAKLLQPLLAAAGYQVLAAASLAEARRAFAEGPPFDLILADAQAHIAEVVLASRPGAEPLWSDVPIVGLAGDHDDPGGGVDAFASIASRHDRGAILRAMRAVRGQIRKAA